MIGRTLGKVAALAVLGALIGGCATSTRIAQFGPLPGGAKLVTLVVSDDVGVVRRECAELGAIGRVLGCQASRPVRGGAGPLPIRAMTIVRYAETLPSEVTFEIDAHELCHTIAVLQFLEDPCHEGNDGMLQGHHLRAAAPTLR